MDVWNRKIFPITYAGDIALLATSIEELKEMMKRLRKYLEKKGLELNAGKTKVMTFRKSNKGRKKKINLGLKYDEAEIEMVKEFNYLGYVISEDLSN